MSSSSDSDSVNSPDSSGEDFTPQVDLPVSSEDGEVKSSVHTVRINLPPSGLVDAAEMDTSEPVFFNISPEKVSSEEEPPSLDSLEDAPPSLDSLDNVPPSLPANLGRVQGQIDPEFANLPDAPGPGAKLAFYAIVLSVLGGLLLSLPFLGVTLVKPLTVFPIFLLAFIIAVVSFFKKPTILTSILGTVFSLGGLVFALLMALVFSVGNHIKAHPEIGEEMAKEMDKSVTDRKLEVMKKAGVELPDLKRNLPNDVLALPGTPDESEEGVVVEDAVEVDTVPVPPEFRVSEKAFEPSSSLVEADVVLPPEEREIHGMGTRKEILGRFWVVVERGLGPGASPDARMLSSRVATVLGYPLSVFESMGADLRLYVLDQKFDALGVDLLEFKQEAKAEDSELYVPAGSGGSGSSGVGPGPLPASKSSTSLISLDQIRPILEKRRFGTLTDGVGKFTEGLTPVQLRSLVEESLATGGRVDGSDGNYYIRARFDRQVGWDSSGLAATRVQLLMNSDGVLEDIFPY